MMLLGLGRSLHRFQMGHTVTWSVEQVREVPAREGRKFISCLPAKTRTRFDIHGSVSVSRGYFSATIDPRDALAIHTGARGSGTPAVAVTFEETATTTYGEVRTAIYFVIISLIFRFFSFQNIFIVGSISQLGSWSPASSVRSHYVWGIDAYREVSGPSVGGFLPRLECNAPLTAWYNFPVQVHQKGDEWKRKKVLYLSSFSLNSTQVVWESDPNRQLTVASTSQTVTTSWR